MTAVNMHANEVHTDAQLVGRLLAAQFPQWADLPLTPVSSAGTDNALYRLGGDMVVRLPRIDWAVGQAEKERRWLPRLAPHLPLAIPEQLAMGEAGRGLSLALVHLSLAARRERHAGKAERPLPGGRATGPVRHRAVAD
jgi:aminoglycoside phosphotransferase (APT) family kinase protein